MSDAGWRWQTSTVTNPPATIATLLLGGRPARFAEVLSGWRSDESFRRAWSQWLAAIPMTSYCWELPPLTRTAFERQFEAAFVDSPALAIAAADPAPFADHLPGNPQDQDAVSFANLGGDALLIAPSAQAELSCYAHLAAFVRNAPVAQASSLWKAVAQVVDQQLGDRSIWISTAGLGVAWLHVRIDSSPKYYRYRPYASPDFWQGRSHAEGVDSGG